MELATIGFDQSGAGIRSRIGAFRIDNNRDPVRSCGGDQTGNGVRGQDTLRIVRKDHRRHSGKYPFRSRHDGLGDVVSNRRCRFRIDPEQLVPIGQIPRLDGGRSAGIGNQVCVETVMNAAQRPRGFGFNIGADHCNKGNLGPESRDIGGDVARSAQRSVFGSTGQNRNRRLGRYTAHRALHETVDQQIADYQYLRLSRVGL